MYEKNFKGNEAVRQLRFRQGKRNRDERLAIVTEIENIVEWGPRHMELNLTVRTEEERGIFQATRIQGPSHFPYIVPELVDEHGDYLLITWLTYGSLLRLLHTVR